MKSNYDTHMADLADHAAEQLQGTCQSLASLNLEDAEDNQTFCNRLDELVFCCEQCGWWCEQSEMANRKDEEWICTDCTGDEDLAEDD
jgi:C4-type Zn-finger protein